jgi:hypothetical protein
MRRVAAFAQSRPEGTALQFEMDERNVFREKGCKHDLPLESGENVLDPSSDTTHVPELAQAMG